MPPGSWLLDPLLPRSSSRSILQAFLEFRSGRSRLFQNMSGGTPSANMVSWRGNIFATLRVVEESDLPETAVIRSTTYSGNVVIELVRQFILQPLWHASDAGNLGLQSSFENC